MVRKRGDVVREIVKKVEMPQYEVRRFLEALETTILDYISGGDSVLFGRIGKFDVKVHKAKLGRNPATGVSISVPATRRAKFKFYGPTKKRVKENRGGLSAETRISSE